MRLHESLLQKKSNQVLIKSSFYEVFVAKKQIISVVYDLETFIWIRQLKSPITCEKLKRQAVFDQASWEKF